jgi:Exopolysaccharide biosynthesis protein YbjH
VPYTTLEFTAGSLKNLNLFAIMSDVLWQQDQHVSWGISLRSVLGEAKFQAQREARANKRYSRRNAMLLAEPSLQTVSEQLQAELIERGLENVRITVARLELGMTVVVEYENRRYNRDELDALGLVLGVAALRTPPLITQMRVIVKKVNIPVLEVSTSVEAFLAFVNEQMSAAAFALQFHITQEVHWPLPTIKPEATTDIRNRSWLKFDLFVEPRIETLILTELGVADLRFSLLPDAFIQLIPGMVVNARGAIPVTQTSGFPGELGDPAVDRVLLHQAVRLPLGTWSRWATGLTQLSIGRFSQEEVGIANETALTLSEGVFSVTGMLARVGSSPTNLDRSVALANGRVRYPPWDLTLSVTAGRFLDQDRGVTADLSRFFGNTEIGLFFRHTDNGSLAGLRFAVPLTPAKELPPWRFRPRLPDLFTYQQSTTVLTDVNIIRGDIGRELRTGHAIERVYWNRDRLYPAYIRQHVDTLKQAVRKWIDETS